MDEIATCVAFASSRIIVKGILDSGYEGLCFDTVTSIDGKSKHPYAQGGLEIICLRFVLAYACMMRDEVSGGQQVLCRAR